MSEQIYRTPTADDVGKIVEVSDSQSFGAREQNRLDDIRDSEWKVNGLWWPYARIRVYTEPEVNAAIAATIEELRAERDTAIAMLAAWCVMVDINGSGWDDWDEGPE